MRYAALASLLILLPCPLRAQDKRGDWKALYGVRSGEKIELVETSMKKHVGTFSSLEPPVPERARESARPHRDVPLRLLRSTYVASGAASRSASVAWWG